MYTQVTRNSNMVKTPLRNLTNATPKSQAKNNISINKSSDAVFEQNIQKDNVEMMTPSNCDNKQNKKKVSFGFCSSIH